MAIHYALFENRLTPDPDDYSAVVQVGDSADMDEVADRIAQGGSVVGRAEILAVLEKVLPTCEAILLEGRRVQFGGLFELFPRMGGTFNSQSDSFDSARHTVDVGANPGSRIREGVRQNAEVVKDEAILPAPNPIQFLDLGSGATNQTLTPASIGQLTGNRLKYNQANADEGIFFVPTGGGAATQVDNSQVLENKPSRLIFLNPSISGDLRLEVRARQRDSADLRIGALTGTLTAGP